MQDNNTTGRFTGQEFVLSAVRLGTAPTETETATAAFRQLHGDGVRLFLANLPADELLALADLPEASDSLLFNIGARNDRLRTDECRANLLHAAPSRAMQTDALAQFLAWKRCGEIGDGGNRGRGEIGDAGK